MRSCQDFLRCVIGVLAALLFAIPPAWAQHQKIVGGMVVNVGVVPASQVVGLAGEAETHGTRHPSGSQHILVSLSDAKTGAQVADANVSVEIKDPKGNVQKKSLKNGSTAGTADYSEIFGFGWSGKYRIRVTIQPGGAKKAQKTDFIWTHVIS